MTAKSSGRRFGPRQVRVLERLMHVVTGLALVIYVYATPAPSSAFTVGIRWLVPVVVSSGLAMWQGPRVRRYMRRRRAGA
jgi:hypothetical protein